MNERTVSMKSVMTMMPTNLRAPESHSGAACVSVVWWRWLLKGGQGSRRRSVGGG